MPKPGGFRRSPPANTPFIRLIPIACFMNGTRGRISPPRDDECLSGGREGAEGLIKSTLSSLILRMIDNGRRLCAGSFI